MPAKLQEFSSGKLEVPESPKPEPRPAPLPPPELPWPPEPSEPPAPSELVAYETADPEDAGWKDEVAPEGEVPYVRFDDEPKKPPEPKTPQGRYVPRPSAESQAKFIRREGTGEDKQK